MKYKQVALATIVSLFSGHALAQTTRPCELTNIGTSSGCPPLVNVAEPTETAPAIEKHLLIKLAGRGPLLARVVYSDGTMEERGADFGESLIWNSELAKDKQLQVLDITGREIPTFGSYGLLDKSAATTDVQSAVVWPGTPTDEPLYRRTKDTAPPDSAPSASRTIVEDMLDIPNEHRGKSGRQCTETNDPDGTRSVQCSQVWSKTTTY